VRNRCVCVAVFRHGVHDESSVYLHITLNCEGPDFVRDRD
jgi:hypothetical protein